MKNSISLENSRIENFSFCECVFIIQRLSKMVFCLKLLILLLVLNVSEIISFDTKPKPSFPLQFSGNLEIVSHLIEENSDYPPQKRRWSIYYDYINKRARADIESGYEAAKYYIRRYDQKNEYMIRLPPIDDCKRSYLGEKMPFPEIPEESEYIGQETIDDIPCHHWIYQEYDIRVHIYLGVEDSSPVRLLQEQMDEETETSTPLLTYKYSDVAIGSPDESWFELESPYDHKSCVRHIGGFPYLHVFHYFVRF
jgi:hypothetical protein